MLQEISLKKKENKREKEKKRKKKKTRGSQAFSSEVRYFIFQEGLLYFDLCIEGNEGCEVMQNQPKHSSSFALIETRIFPAYLSHKQCCVHYLLALEVCEHFMTLF